LRLDSNTIREDRLFACLSFFSGMSQREHWRSAASACTRAEFPDNPAAMMKKNFAFAVLSACLFMQTAISTRAEFWPCWRGPRGDGTCLEKNVPSNWDPTNAIWKVELPGIGHASPIVWGDRIFTVTSLPDTTERVLLGLDRATGKLLWRQAVVKGPLEKLHKENSYASGTPATDGERVYVAFRVGDEIVVAAHDFATGKQLWLVRPGTHAGE
jgi:hypothetical protein